MGSQSWFPVASRTSGDGPRIGSIHDISTCRKQGDHLPVARIGVLAVVGAADEKERPLARPGCIQPAHGFSSSTNFNVNPSSSIKLR
jgi:hypothetical protein